jgi:integrase
MPRHLKMFDGVWYYFRRVPRQFGDVEPRKFIKIALSNSALDQRPTADRNEAERRRPVAERQWRALVELWTAKKRAHDVDEVTEAEKTYRAAVELARLGGFEYRTARELAEGATLSELLKRIERIERMGMLDTGTGTAAIGLIDHPTVTFRQAAAGYLGDRESGWKNQKHRAQWSSTLEAYVYPELGDLDVGSIETNSVLKCLRPIWAAKPETASRVRSRIEAILAWATVRGYRSGENPARWRGHLDAILPARGAASVKHHPALHFALVPAFLADLRQRTAIAALALEFTILTAVRTGETVGAVWSEFERDGKPWRPGDPDGAMPVWVIPKERMKASRAHRVPLTDAAVDVLRRLPADLAGPFVFPSVMRSAKGEPRAMSNMAMLTLLERMKRTEITVHGFRSSFRDWAAETTGFPNHVVEMALAHVVGDKVEAAYRRGELFEQRRDLMEAWARYCMAAPNGPGGKEGA